MNLVLSYKSRLRAAGLLKTLMFVIFSRFSSSLLSDRERNDGLLLEPPCVILTIGLSSNSLVGSVLLVLLGRRYLLLKEPFAVLLALVVLVVATLFRSLYLPGTEFASSVRDLYVGGVYLLAPLLRVLLESLSLDASVRGASAGSSSATRTPLLGLVLNRTRSRYGLDERVRFRDAILTLDLTWLLDGAVVAVSDEPPPGLRRVKPNGRGCDTEATVDLLAVVDWLVLLAGTVVSRISVAESSTSFTASVVGPIAMSSAGLTLDGLSDGSTLITVMTSVDVEVVGATVVGDDVEVVAGVLGASGESTTLVDEAISLAGSANGRIVLDGSSVTFEVVLRNLCMLTYLKGVRYGRRLDYTTIVEGRRKREREREEKYVRKNLDFVVDEPSSFSADRSVSSEPSLLSEFLKLFITDK